MASPTLPAFSSQGIPQTFPDIIDRPIDRVVFGICCYEEPLGSYNDHNAQLCNSSATLHNLEDGFDYCERHFRKVVARHPAIVLDPTGVLLPDLLRTLAAREADLPCAVSR